MFLSIIHHVLFLTFPSPVSTSSFSTDNDESYFRTLRAGSVSERTDGQMDLNDFHSRYEHRDNSSKRKNTQTDALFYSDDTSNTAMDGSSLKPFPPNGGVSPKQKRRRTRRRICQPGKHTFPANNSPTMVKNMERTKST